MGDAGPPLPALGDDNGTEQREVTVLVTGFGPFKTFTHNPSHLISTRLPPVLLPTPTPSPPSNPNPNLNPNHKPPIINLHIHLPPLRVSYPTVATTIPTLLWPAPSPTTPIDGYDYILHLGMAAGRRHYALETLAHRDGYTIKDVDNVDGVDVGSRRWAAEGCPSVLEVGWDRVDVLGRWRDELKRDGAATTAAKTEVRVGGTRGSIPDVRLSNDAGRFVCDFIFYASLSERWKDARRQPSPPPPPPPHQPEAEAAAEAEPEPEPKDTDLEITCSSLLLETSPTIPTSKEGKVAFLHVPGDTDPVAIERGVRVTEAAVRAIVASWEEGYRRGGGRVAVSGSQGSSHSRGGEGMVAVGFVG